MIQKLLSGVLALALAPAAFGQSSPTYENWGVVECPPEIPPNIVATNFVNHGDFVINFTNGLQQGVPLTAPPYETSDTVNYTNDFGALLSCNTGFRLDMVSLQSGLRNRGGTVYNNGDIECGTVGTSNLIVFGGAFFAIFGTPSGISTKINATNVVNPGTINMGFDSLLTIEGDNVDITHGNLTMETTGFNIFNGGFRTFSGGFFDGYWGLGTTNIFYPNGFPPATYYGANPPMTPLHLVTNRDYTTMYQQLRGPGFAPYLLDVTDSTGSNRTVRAVFLSNTNPAIQAKVYLQAFFPYALDPDYVEFSAVTTNAQAGKLTTNFLYVADSFLLFTNFQLALDGFAGVGVNRPTFIPVNYSFFAGFQLGLGTPAVSSAIPPGTFDASPVTNQYTAYQALFLPGTVVPGDVAGQVVSNTPGRITLTADKVLTLSQARIRSANYLLLKATDHFGGSDGAQNVAPYSDIYLRSTNGLLNLTNVLVPTAPTPLGVCDLYSARWTNVVNVPSGATVTNRFHVFFVDLQLAPDAPAQVMNLNLWSTNSATHDDSIVVRDIFNVTSNLLISTRRLTLTTNAQNSSAPAGVISYLNEGILWPTATPRLQYLTNNGGLQAKNLAVFGGSQSSSYSSPSSSVNPYAAFVNRGGVTNFGSSIFSTYFENSGTFLANGGAIQLRQAQTAILTNGAFLAPGTAGAILIQGGSLLASNHTLLAGQALTLNLTGYLDDGSLSVGADAVTNKNSWYAGYGINLPVLPSQSSLLATTITNVGPAGAIVYNTWAAQDRGPVPPGYVNNAAVGQLILDGLDNRTVFWFQGANGSNALYVDLLQLRDATATNFDGAGNFAGVYLQPNLTVYYGGAVWNGKDISEQINGRYGIGGTNGGRFLWVSNYNTGFFSSTNVTYTDGTVHRLNRALVTSCDIDSNGNSIPNCTDPDPVPVFSSAMLALKAVYIKSPGRGVVVSWNTIPFATNYLYSCSTPPAKTNQWQLVTNFLSDATVGSRVTVTDMLKTNAVRYYRVRVVSP